MNRSYFRTAAVIGLLQGVLITNMMMLVGQAQKKQATAPVLTETILAFNRSGIPNSGATGVGQSPPDRIRFNFSGYANPQRPFPGYVGEWQLGPVNISGSGEIRGSDGALVSGGQITHTDNLRDRRYPNHSATWQVVKMLDLKSAGGRTELWLQVQVTSSNYLTICPVGTYGVLQLVDDNRRLKNGYASDAIVTQMPNPSSTASDGLPACRTHVHGFNNVDYSYTDPPRGGANGGIWAIVEISDTGSRDLIAGMWVSTWDPKLAPGTLGSSSWSLTPLEGNRYQLQQFDHGRATGIAVVTGTRIRVDWTCCGGSWAGYDEYDLDSSGTSGQGISVITKGDRERVGKRVPTLIRRSR